MADEEAFLKALEAAPDDDLTKLIYADWLEDRGDPRAEYIRLRDALGAVAPYTDRYAELRTRLKAVRQGINPAWAAALYRARHRPLFATLPESRSHRWQLMDEFIEVWHPPLGLDDGFPERQLQAAQQRLGIRLPAALCEWYALGGQRGDIWSRQDSLLAPDRLWIDTSADILVFLSENQGCEHWGIRVADLELEDPPVIEVGASVEASPTVTAFACLVLLYEVMWVKGVILAGGTPSEGARAAAVRGLSRCDLPEQYWVATPLRLFEGDDLIIGLHADEWVYVVARGEEAFRRVDAEVREHLEVYSQ